jgi:hydrogenase expression/formation protein HypC
VCLAIPARVTQIEGNKARVDMAGNTRKVDLTLLPDVAVGEFVLVHAGFAIGTYDEETAEQALRDLEEAARLLSESEQGK